MRDAVDESRRSSAALDDRLRDELAARLIVGELDARTRKRFVRATRLVYERIARAIGGEAVDRAVAAAADVRPVGKPPREKVLRDKAAREKARSEKALR